MAQRSTSKASKPPIQIPVQIVDAPSRVVRSKPTVYHPVTIDTRREHGIHYCDLCAPERCLEMNMACPVACHHGQCRPVNLEKWKLQNLLVRLAKDIQDKANQTAAIRPSNRSSSTSSDHRSSGTSSGPSTPRSSSAPKMIRRIPVEDDPILQAIERLNLNKRGVGAVAGAGYSDDAAPRRRRSGSGEGEGRSDDDTVNAQRVIADAVNALMNMEKHATSPPSRPQHPHLGGPASGRSGRIRLMPHEARAIPVHHVRGTPSPPPSPSRASTPTSSLNSSAFSINNLANGTSGPPSPTPSTGSDASEADSGIRFPHHIHHHHHHHQSGSERRPLSAMSGQSAASSSKERKSIPVQVFHSGGGGGGGRSTPPVTRAESPPIRQIPVQHDRGGTKSPAMTPTSSSNRRGPGPDRPVAVQRQVPIRVEYGDRSASPDSPGLQNRLMKLQQLQNELNAKLTEETSATPSSPKTTPTTTPARTNPVSVKIETPSKKQNSIFLEPKVVKSAPGKIHVDPSPSSVHVIKIDRGAVMPGMQVQLQVRAPEEKEKEEQPEKRPQRAVETPKSLAPESGGKSTPTSPSPVLSNRGAVLEADNWSTKTLKEKHNKLEKELARDKAKEVVEEAPFVQETPMGDKDLVEARKAAENLREAKESKSAPSAATKSSHSLQASIDALEKSPEVAKPLKTDSGVPTTASAAFAYEIERVETGKNKDAAAPSEIKSDAAKDAYDDQKTKNRSVIGVGGNKAIKAKEEEALKKLDDIMAQAKDSIESSKAAAAAATAAKKEAASAAAAAAKKEAASAAAAKKEAASTTAAAKREAAIATAKKDTSKKEAPKKDAGKKETVKRIEENISDGVVVDLVPVSAKVVSPPASPASTPSPISPLGSSSPPLSPTGVPSPLSPLSPTPQPLQPTLPSAQSSVVSPPSPRPPKTPELPNVRPQPQNIPPFYFPLGRRDASARVDDAIEACHRAAKVVFDSADDGKLDKTRIADLTKALDLPLYWKGALWAACVGGDAGNISYDSFQSMWTELTTEFHDEASRFVRMLCRPGTNYLTQDDLHPLIQDVVDTHPGLQFLQDSPAFHPRYIMTVIARIFYTTNRSWSGKITATELRKSSFLKILAKLEQEEDINNVTDYFSYEHFYVIYCKFWELDRDHDLQISKADLLRHNDFAVSARVIDRVFSGAVYRTNPSTTGFMTYADFIWFLLSEEDKRTPTAIEYWFRCMDVDGDGALSMYELEYFYDEQRQRMEALCIEPLPFEDCLCQMLDMINPEHKGVITLGDLKRNRRLCHVFYDTFLNVEKYIDHEQRDPFACVKEYDSEGNEVSDWDRYAAEEYEILVAEESHEASGPVSEGSGVSAVFDDELGGQGDSSDGGSIDLQEMDSQEDDLEAALSCISAVPGGDDVLDALMTATAEKSVAQEAKSEL